MPDTHLYDEIGTTYKERRSADPAIEAMILDALGNAESVLNVGAGTGSYEPHDRRVIAVEPSTTMIAQRPPGAAPAVQATAEALPVGDASFDAALAVVTIHHWADVTAGLGELRRAARRQVVLTFDFEVHAEHWLVDYVPDLDEVFRRGPSLTDTARILKTDDVRTVLLARDTPDGMAIAFWGRPWAYLDPAVRAGGSAFHAVDQEALERGLARLRAELDDGRWEVRYGYLLQTQAIDCGLRLVVAGR